MDFDFTTETITPDTTNLLTIGGPGALEVPVGTTAERPVTGLSNGALRYNTDLNVIEGYVNTSWSTIATTGVVVSSFSAGTTGLTPNSPTTGAIVLGGTLVAANGGTGQSTYAIGDILYASAATTLSKLADVAAGSYLRSGGVTTAPLWSTTTLPNSATTGDLMYASASNTYSNLADVATGNALISGGVGVAPSWGKIGLTTHVSGTLPIANGGTNSSTALSGSSIMVSNGTSVIQGAAGTTTTVLHGNAAGAPTYGAVVLTTDVSGILPLANGGTNANLTAVNGGAVYSTGSALAITAAGTAGQVLTSNGAAAPTWQAASATLQLYKENPSSPTAPSATGTNAIAMLSGSAASATNSSAMGDGTSASIWSTQVYGNGSFATAGDAQGVRVVARVITTNNTATEMFLDGAGASQRLVLPNNSAWNYFIQIVARRTDATGKWSAWNFTGLIKKDGTAGTTSNSVSRTNIDKNGIGSDPTVTADTTNGSLLITVTGNTSETIRWVATINISQVTN
jgi:hypothetical protein